MTEHDPTPLSPAATPRSTIMTEPDVLPGLPGYGLHYCILSCITWPHEDMTVMDYERWRRAHAEVGVMALLDWHIALGDQDPDSVSHWVHGQLHRGLIPHPMSPRSCDVCHSQVPSWQALPIRDANTTICHACIIAIFP